MANILVLETDKDLNKRICERLDGLGYNSIGCIDADDFEKKTSNKHIDLAIADILFPKINKMDFVKALWKRDESIPILFATDMNDLNDKRDYFRLGTDDYMVKPIDLTELIVRVNALLRRSGILVKKVLKAGDLEMYADEHIVYHNGERLHMTVREFDILFSLIANPKNSFTREQILEECWFDGSQGNTRVVDVYISKLRDKLKDCEGVRIETIHGLGYRAVLP